MSLKPAESFRTKFLIGHSDLVALWVGKILKIKDFGKCETVGITKNDKLICGVVFNNFYKNPLTDEPISIESSIASVDKSWCTRHNLGTLFAYPFIQLNVKRLQTTCPAGNPDTRSFNERLGFQLEGIGREAYIHGGDAAVYSMLKHECKWIEHE